MEDRKAQRITDRRDAKRNSVRVLSTGYTLPKTDHANGTKRLPIEDNFSCYDTSLSPTKKLCQVAQVSSTTCCNVDVKPDAEKKTPHLNDEMEWEQEKAPWKSKFDDDSDTDDDGDADAESDNTDSSDELLTSAEFQYTGVFLKSFGSCRDVTEFQIHSIIGDGTFGRVYRAKDLITGEVVALKRLLVNDDEDVPIAALREVKLLSRARHPNIVSFREVAVNHDISKMYIVMECLEYDLRALISNQKVKFSVGEVKTMMLHLLRGVLHLHGNGIMHRDLKPSNLLISNNGVLKIADLGIARECTHPEKSYNVYTPLVVTLWYRAPELLLGTKEYGPAIDMWSVGCIMYELLNGKPLFPGKSELDQLHLMFKTLGTPTETIWPGLHRLPGLKNCNFKMYPYNLLAKRCQNTLSSKGFELLNRLLAYDPSKRFTADYALNSQWFVEKPSSENVAGFLRTIHCLSRPFQQRTN